MLNDVLVHPAIGLRVYVVGHHIVQEERVNGTRLFLQISFVLAYLPHSHGIISVVRYFCFHVRRQSAFQFEMDTKNIVYCNANAFKANRCESDEKQSSPEMDRVCDVTSRHTEPVVCVCARVH